MLSRRCSARPGLTTAIDGVHDHTNPPTSGMSETVLAVIAQGGKRLALGEYLVASVALPVTGQVMDTGRAHPGLGHDPAPF
jgi:hypothetical protein